LPPCFIEHRAQAQVHHSIEAMVGQRVFGIALGYENLIDHDYLRHDLVLATLSRQARGPAQTWAPLAGKSNPKPARARAFAAEPLPQDRT
jgi:Transposase DDE domain group 1